MQTDKQVYKVTHLVNNAGSMTVPKLAFSLRRALPSLSLVDCAALARALKGVQ